MHKELLWSFETAHFRVECLASPAYDLDLSWDDTGETQANLASGLWLAFDTEVRVTHRMTGAVLGQDYLCGSIYERPGDFVTEHLGCRPKGYGSYFPDMVREAIGEARKNYKALMVARVREVA